jgi:hypothetical protein
MDIKAIFEKLTEIIQWLADTWRDGTWGKRLILLAGLLAALLLFLKTDIPSKWGLSEPLLAEHYIYYWLIVGLLIVSAFIIEIRRPRIPNNPVIGALQKNSAIRDLYAFDFDDTEIFKQLQRNVILDKITKAIINPDFKFGILYGESGCGKTSFLKAGLCAALKQNGHYLPVYIKFDKESPETYLYTALKKELPSTNLPGNNHDLLAAVLNQNNGKSIIFIFYQFEQFFLHQPRVEQRVTFIQLLASWYQTNQPVKILLGIRRDYFSYAIEIAPEINSEFEHNQKEVFKLLNFTVTEATAVFKVLAQTADLAFDENAVETICRNELAKQDGLILPADIQILASVIRDLPRQENHQGFNRDTFLKVGGVEGLLNNFLKNNLEILPLKKRKAVLKVLRALIDRNRNLRAGELTLVEIESKANDISPEDIKDAVDWSMNTRLMIAIEDEELHINKYQLTHEKLIPSVLLLVGELSDDVEKANSLLERRTNEWLGNLKAKRFLLNFNELKLINKQQHSLVWGDNQRDKEMLIAVSQRKHQTNLFVYAVLPIVTLTAYGVWWLSPSGEIHECKNELNKQAIAATDSVRQDAISQALNNGSVKINKQNLQVTRVSPLQYLQTAIAEKISDEQSKAEVFTDLATAAGTLGNKEQGLAYLTQLQAAAEKISDEQRKSYVFSTLATAAGMLGDKEQGFAYLMKALGIAKKISDEQSKDNVFSNLARAAGTLGNPEQGLAYLTQLQTAAEKISDEQSKAEVFTALATAAGTLGNKKQAWQFSYYAVNAARKAKADDNPAFLQNAELNAQAGNYRKACELARDKEYVKSDGLKILAVVLREYTKEHDL